MKQQKINKRFFSWQFAKLERELDRQSRDGWQLSAATFARRTYTQGGEPCRHRVAYCPSRVNSADYITYVAAQTNHGWELVCQDQGWLFFRKPLSRFAPEESQRLREDRDGIRSLFTKRVRKQENIRIVALLLAAALLVLGYATTNWILRLAALPLAVMLFNTYLIKFMNEALENDALDD